MKQILFAALAVMTAAACGSTDTGTDAGIDAGIDAGQAYDSSAKILNYFDNKSMVMAGTDIPVAPLGFNQNVNYGAASQCYHQVTIATLAEEFTVTSILGVIHAATDGGFVGSCDNTAVGATVAFTSSSVLITNVKGNASCFDILATYTGFAQEGRGMISADGKTVSLELYFSNQTIGHSCADGAVGSGTAKFAATDGGTTPIVANTVQVYRIP
jgi:hypothetical protein